jgi:hypothetical protein
MLIECLDHGLQEETYLSVDLLPLGSREELLREAIYIVYEFKGTVVFEMYVSAEFSTTHGLENVRRLPLPDAFPGWFLALQPVCQACVAEALIQAAVVRDSDSLK